VTWQEWVEQRAASLGLTRTSGYRTPGQERALGGPASSYHSRGTPGAPGALDIGGSADKLTQLFREIRAAFAGRINELYLNIPGGQSLAIKNDRGLSTNPEAGRARHLHVALGASVGPLQLPQPATRIPAEGRGEKALEAAPADVCVRKLCPPDFRGAVAGALGREVKPQENCVCWSDVWVYGVAVSVIVSGALMAFWGRRQ